MRTFKTITVTENSLDYVSHLNFCQLVFHSKKNLKKNHKYERIRFIRAILALFPSLLLPLVVQTEVRLSCAEMHPRPLR